MWSWALYQSEVKSFDLWSRRDHVMITGTVTRGNHAMADDRDHMAKSWWRDHSQNYEDQALFT